MIVKTQRVVLNCLTAPNGEQHLACDCPLIWVWDP